MGQTNLNEGLGGYTRDEWKEIVKQEKEEWGIIDNA